MMCIRVGNAFVETRGRHFGKVERPWGWCVAEVVYLLFVWPDLFFSSRRSLFS